MSLQSVKNDVLRVFSQNGKVGVIIIVLELVLVLCYNYVPIVNIAMNAMASLKMKMSIIYSMISTGLFMGVVPWLVDIFQGHIRPALRVRTGIFMFLCYAFVGLQTDIFYGLQSAWFGDEGVLSVVEKMLIDQLIWTPLYMSHFNYWANFIYNTGVTLPKCSTQIIKKYFQHDWLVGLIGGYIIWVPSCCVIYAMEPALQLIMMNLVGVLFVVVMATITRANGLEESRTFESMDQFELP
ncbi:hypothetical protein EIN_311790 [Entamoeba invadens IP1]|uniref:Uncharacterized protein n=1 Tax=Entamoeba invadens IP1 TaxID=370355 RepID=A0A0A1TUX6_ENTIV|nr:hypothetical protein EIN_311790 [Entamoeba invadens IP1]ELP83918.1 hypothetical protein EIN_311790 [Entamoeba invadens IP1]|eukprot:XP_004183264.1 hypothetical protein EIN_311790 [Entamoeba invadens IP1]